MSMRAIVVSAAILPLAEAAEAHRRLESRQSFGKIVLDVLDPG